MLNFAKDPHILIADRVESLRDSYKTDLSLEAVMIEVVPLEHSRMTVILLGGIGRDGSAPSCYKPWAGSDFLCGIYQHPKYPKWYVRPDVTACFEKSALVRRIAADFSDLLEMQDVREIIRIMIQLFYY